MYTHVRICVKDSLKKTEDSDLLGFHISLSFGTQKRELIDSREYRFILESLYFLATGEIPTKLSEHYPSK